MIADLEARLCNARRQGLSALDEPAGKEILVALGISVPRSRVISPEADIRAAIDGISPPYVLKVIAPDVVHKSDVGGVRLGLQDASELEAAISQLRAGLLAKRIIPSGWLIEEMISGGVEVVVGGLTDPEFGPMVMVGLGGVFVEVLKDVAFRICPIVRRDAVEMIDELRGAPLLRGARGREPASIDAVVDVLLRLGGEHGLLTQCQRHISEIDINPLIVTRDRACAVDARFILCKPD